MRQRRILVAGLAVLTLAACQAKRPGGAAPISLGAAPAALVAPGAASALVGTSVSGSVRAPRPLIGVGVGSFIGVGVGSLIGVGVGSLIGDGAGSMSLQSTAELDEVPLVGATVAITDAAGKPIPGLKSAETDARGMFTVTNVPADQSVLVTVTFQGAKCQEAKLQALVRTGAAGDPIVIDTASTLLAAAATAAAQGPLGRFDATAYATMLGRTRDALTAADLPDFCDPGSVAATMSKVIGRVAALQADLAAVKQDLGATQAGLADLQAQVAALAKRTPDATPLPPAATVLGTYTVGATPRGLVIDGQGRVWVANYRGDTVTRLSPTGQVEATIEVGKSPLGLAVDAAGNVWVACYAGNEVDRLSPDGKLLSKSTIETPFGVAIDAAGNAWVPSYKNKKGMRFKPDGSVLGEFPTGSRPFGLAIAPTGEVWVANYADHAVSKLDADGKPLGTVRVDRGPQPVKIDSRGHIWVVASDAARLDELGTDGNVLNSYETGGLQAWGLAIDAKSGNVWVTNPKVDDRAPSATLEDPIDALQPPDRGGQGTVAAFARDGRRLGVWSTGGGPQGIAIDAQGNAWVALQGNNVVVKLAPAP